MKNVLYSDRFVENDPITWLDLKGMRTIKREDVFGIITYEFTNLNVTVFKSNGCAIGPAGEIGGTPFSTNAWHANDGRQSFAIDDEGVFYFTVEDLSILDKKVGMQNLLTLGRFIVSYAADLAFITSVAKSLESGATLVEATVNGLSIETKVNPSNTNLIVQNVASLTENKSLRRHIADVLLNFLPFYGTIGLGNDIIDSSEPTISIPVD